MKILINDVFTTKEFHYVTTTQITGFLYWRKYKSKVYYRKRADLDARQMMDVKSVPWYDAVTLQPITDMKLHEQLSNSYLWGRYNDER